MKGLHEAKLALVEGREPSKVASRLCKPLLVTQPVTELPDQEICDQLIILSAQSQSVGEEVTPQAALELRRLLIGQTDGHQVKKHLEVEFLKADNIPQAVLN